MVVKELHKYQKKKILAKNWKRIFKFENPYL